MTTAISLVNLAASPGLLFEPFLWWRTSGEIGSGPKITRAFCSTVIVLHAHAEHDISSVEEIWELAIRSGWENKFTNAGDTAAEIGGNNEIVVISVIKNVDKNDLSGAKFIKAVAKMGAKVTNGLCLLMLNMVDVIRITTTTALY
ncbi:Hypothetical predicted protein [Olea europaea subsp. europaea]|uniref:Uncharacterized protein n=1 Tax=Olea europaea subsp. europaea TaxID=158383 RepID=A0A8S0TWE0_OLEEU|nr:Hypothetical predicted protein [Olea europaea subsp. europaea]